VANSPVGYVKNLVVLSIRVLPVYIPTMLKALAQLFVINRHRLYVDISISSSLQ